MSNFKLPPPPPLPPFILIKHYEKIKKNVIFKPNREIYGDITTSLGNSSNVENYIGKMEFEKKKMYEKKKELCKDFKSNEQETNNSFSSFIQSSINTITSPLSIISRKTVKPQNQNQNQDDEEEKERKLTEIPEDVIVLNINTKKKSKNYKKNIIKWD